MTINLTDDVRLLGPSGLRVSPLTLGTMTFGDGGWRAGEDNARAIFTAYLEAGGNGIDTADAYGGGHAEQLLGHFMADTKTRDQLVVATQASAPTGSGANERGNGRKHLLAALEGSLRRLRTDYVDVFWLHLWDGVTPVAEVMATLAQIVADGKARAVGLSNVPAWYATAASMLADRHGWAAPVALQLEYSLLERTAETEHVPAAQHCGMSLVPWSPLANGFLTGKYTRAAETSTDEPDAGEGRLAAAAGYPDQRTHTDRDWAVLASVRDAATTLGCSPAQVALAWTLHQPAVATTLIGATSPEQLHANLDAAALTLPNDVLHALDSASRQSTGSPYRLLSAATG